MQSTTSLPLTPPSNQGSSAQTTQHAQMVHHAQVATGGMARLAPASSPGAMASAAGAMLEPQAQPAYTRESIQALLAQRTPGQRLDLRGADLSGLNLAGLDFRNVDLTDANLNQAKLRRSDFSGTSLKGAKLAESDLTGADLIGADLTGANLTGADFWEAHLENAIFTGANLEGAKFEWAHLEGANFTGANLTGVKFARAHLEGAKFTGANLTGVKFARSHLEGANFTGANLTGATFESTDVRNAIFQDAILIATLFEDVTIADNNDAMANMPSFKNALVTGTLFNRRCYDGGQEDERWSRHLSTLLKDSKGLPLIGFISIHRWVKPSVPFVYYLSDNREGWNRDCRQLSFDDQWVTGTLYKRLKAMNPPHASLPTLKVALTAEEQRCPDVVAAVEQWAADNPERRITLLPNAQGTVDVTHVVALHRVALDGMALEHTIIPDSQLKAVSEQPNGMMSIMTRYHTYTEAFKNRIQRVCGHGALWQLLGEVSKSVKPAERGGEIQLDIGSSLLSASDDHKGWDLPVGYQKDKGKSVHHLIPYQTMTSFLAEHPKYFESHPWQLSQPETLLIAILNASQGMPRDRQAAIITELQRVAHQTGDERLTCLVDGIKIVG